MESLASGYQKSLKFINSIQQFELPIDENKDNKLQQVRGFNYSKVTPTPLANVRVAALSQPCMQWIGLRMPEPDEKDEEVNAEAKELAELLSGNKLFEGSQPFSHCYCGHQFGVFAGQLGDGRAISLGDVQSVNEIDDNAENLVDLQLKGAGLTPYSRRADGRAVLRSSIREFLCSEAMYALGIPTTRAASLIVSDTTVARDKLYTGNVIHEKCAVVMRVAPTFMRFGSFEIFKDKDARSGGVGPSNGLKEQMQPKMLDYLLKYFFSEVSSQFDGSEDQLSLQRQLMLEKIVKDTAELAALWQCNGFCHGVLNTDNMSIVGATIDYGPFAWMENFNPDFICNHSDKEKGRYKYKAQPEICEWNLYRLCEALDPLVDLEFSTNFIRANYQATYQAAYDTKMGQKLGFLLTSPPEAGVCDGFSGIKRHLVDEAQGFRKLTKQEKECITSLMETMAKTGSDFTDTFRVLGKLKANSTNKQELILHLLAICAPIKLLDKKNLPKFSATEIKKLEEILRVQPAILPMLGISVEEARTEVEKFQQLQAEDQNVDNAAREQELSQQNQGLWYTWVEEYITTLNKTAESATFDSPEAYDTARAASMNSRANPAFILRNYQMEEAIKAAETNDDFSQVDLLLQRALNPFEDPSGANQGGDAPEQRPDWRFDICVSCSS